MGFREALFSATQVEVRLHTAGGGNYVPSQDHRFIWACQWLAVAEGRQRRDLEGLID